MGDIPTSQSIQHQTSILSNTISTLSQWLPQNSRPRIILAMPPSTRPCTRTRPPQRMKPLRSERPEKRNTPPSQDITTISERISMSTDGDNLSTSADSHMVNHSTKQLPATSITWRPRLVLRMETKFLMLDVVSVALRERLPNSPAHTLLD